MPVKLTKTKDGKVRVSTPNAVHAKGTTMAKAKAQQRLLNAVEHGWKPTGKKNLGMIETPKNIRTKKSKK